MTKRDRRRMDGGVAVATGAGQPIGRATTVGLASCDCDVVINARRRGDLAWTAAEVELLGRRALIVDGNVFRSRPELNQTTAFQGCKAAAQRMRDGGSIVNISSGAGTRGSPFTGPYAAAKTGMNTLSQTLALEPATRIRVNTVAPGPIATEAFLEMLTVGDQHDQLAATIPIGLGAPDDIVDDTVFLASDATSWTTGHLLLVAGDRSGRSYQYRPKDDT